MNSTQTLIKDLARQYGRDRRNLLPIIQGVVEQENYISEFAMIEIAKELNMPASDVFGTASFYSFLEHRKMGFYVIRVCKTIACAMKGTNQIMHAIEDMLKVKIGETTPDGKFTVLQTNCLGWCHKAPAMLINDEVFTDLSPERVREILGEYMRKNR
ncbi:NAD(P)H-dependent oxidoreductase subunit E [Prolixibacteraceae bacterium JC049]|nr:NAD(P)H-dependent oxidoreductase subunit E [Prolixibacteraceae bacterium JC049]